MSQYKSYRDYLSNPQEVINSFKGSIHYRPILEHVSHEQGLEYYNCITSNKIYSEKKLTDDLLLEILQENDRIGSPILSNYSFGNCSPTSLRYMYHSILILEHIQKLGIENPKIVEVGGGYGGLCLIIERLSKLYNIQISKYYIIDLKEAIDLQKLYLENFDLKNPIELVDADTFGSKIVDQNLYMISNYCLGEIGEYLSNEYKINLFPKLKHGYVIWNTPDSYKCLTESFEVSFEEEVPRTSPYNKIIKF